MGFGKATALAAAIAGGTIAGTWIGPYLTDRAEAMGKATNAQSASPSPPAERHDEAQRTGGSGPVGVRSTPDLQKRLKPLLPRQTDFKSAASGFRDVEGFAAALHASKNIRVPFLLLKRQLVEESRTLAEAIHIVKPTANASLEADLARSEARSDLADVK